VQNVVWCVSFLSKERKNRKKKAEIEQRETKTIVGEGGRGLELQTTMTACVHRHLVLDGIVKTESLNYRRSAFGKNRVTCLDDHLSVYLARTTRAAHDQHVVPREKKLKHTRTS